MEAFSANEYVWDCPRRAPGVVIGVDRRTNGSARYTVAEIILSSKRLGRVASREEDELEPYVNIAISEKGVQRLYALLGEGHQFDEVDIEAFDILKDAMERRGIEPAWSP